MAIGRHARGPGGVARAAGQLPRVRRFLPWLLGAGIIFLTVCASATVGRNEREEVRQLTLVTSDQTRRRFELWFGERRHALERLAEASLAAAGEQAFRDKALELLCWFPGFQAVNRLDGSGVARVVVPLAGNEAVVDFDLHLHPDPSVATAIDAAAAAGVTTRSRVVELRQGGRGFGTYVPILDERGAPAGFVNGVFRIDHAFQVCLPDPALPPDFAIEILEDGQVLLSRGNPDPLAPVQEVQLPLFGRPLTLRLAATPPLVKAHVSGTARFVLASGILVAVLSALVLRLLLARYQQRRRAEAEQLESEREQARVTRLESIGRLAGGVAHDFNNYLTAILGSNELALNDLPPESPVRESLEVALQAARRAAEVTRRLLTFARREPGEPAVIEPCKLVEDLARMLPSLLGEDIELHLDLDRDAGCVRIDPTQLEQVLINLIVNARDAMPVGGSLYLRVRRYEAGAAVEIEVEDSGIGMDEEIRAHAFEPFVTSKAEGHGTGLGLATCYGIVRGAGGEIEIESALGRGTRVLVRLPRTEGRAEKTSAVQAGSGVCLPGALVLLAEDQPLVRAVIEETLRGAGHTVLSAPDGEAALRLARGQERRIDLLVTDIVMPRMSGRELAAALRREHPSLAVLFLSGYTDQPPGAGDPLLAKPFTAERLLAAVQRLLTAASTGRC